MNNYLDHLLKNVPRNPGVYKMLDEHRVIIYIGKAKNLSKRLKSYFQNRNDQTIKTLKMVEKISDIEYIITGSELEALILETNLIKEFRPKYNILMKDDKNFAYIKVTVNEPYPRIQIVRKIHKDGAKYFGPKTSASKYYDLLHVLRKMFPFRNCGLIIEDHGPATPDTFDKKRRVTVTRAGIKFPCLDYHIKRCLAPCIGRPDLAEYRQVIDKIIDFLEGRYQNIVTELQQQMLTAATNKQFEKAANLRDKIQSISALFEFQKINSTDHQNTDIINFYQQESELYFNVFQIRDGKLIDQQNTIMKTTETAVTDEDKLAAFMQNFYLSNSDTPQEILLPIAPTDQTVLEEWLKTLSGHRVHLTIPQKGKKEQLLEMSLENAISFAKQSRIKWEAGSAENRQEALEKLGQLLGLTKPPRRMECYDISHLSGTHTVASMVVFENGFPKKDQYRHFKLSINTPGAPDDFLSMKEVLMRRLKYLLPNKISNFKLLKNKEGFRVKWPESEPLMIKTLSVTKLKTFIAPIVITAKLLEELLPSLTNKIKSRRIYIAIRKNQLDTYERLGWELLLSNPTEHKAKRGHIWVAYDHDKHHLDASFSKKPGLIVIDGGKGQLSQAVKATVSYQIIIPIVSLAKKEEEIYIPGQNLPIKLPANDPIRLMIMHLRDEAHRFAIEHNRKLRKKDYTVSALEDIPGIGKMTVQRLLRQFGSLENVKQLTLDQLAETIGPKAAIKIKHHLN